MAKKENNKPHLQFLVTEEQKEQIEQKAKKCGLSRSEYLRQTALGNNPQELLPAAFYRCCETLSNLTRNGYSEEVNQKALSVLADMQRILDGEAVILKEMEDADSEEESVPTVSAVLAEKQSAEQKTENKPKKRFSLFGKR